LPKVAISKIKTPVDEEKVINAVRNAVKLLGGMGTFVKRGEIVLIKPNVVGMAPPPQTTDPRVVKAVALLVKEVGAKPIIGDGSGLTITFPEGRGRNTKDILKVLGFYKIAEEVGSPCEVVPFDEVETLGDYTTYHSRRVKVPGGLVMREADIAEAALDADVIMPVPVMKTSEESGGATLCIKCLHGITDVYTTRPKYHRTDLWQKLVDILKIVRDKVKLGVIDGIKAGEDYLYAGQVDMNVIVAGDDPVSTDAIGHYLMGWDWPVRDVGYLALAHVQGLGEGEMSKIEVVGDRMEDVRKRLKRGSCDIITGPASVGRFPNVVVLEGGACRACHHWTKYVLHYLRSEGVFDKMPMSGCKNLVLILGQDPSIPDDPFELLDLGLPIVWGDCAMFSTKHQIYWQLRDKAVYIPGCPPFNYLGNSEKIIKALGLQPKPSIFAGSWQKQHPPSDIKT